MEKKKTNQIIIRVSPDMKDRIAEAAREESRTMSNWILKIVEENLEDEEEDLEMKAREFVKTLKVGDYIYREDIIGEEEQIIIAPFDGKGYRTKNAYTKEEMIEDYGEDDGRYDDYDQDEEGYILAEDLRYPGARISTKDGLWTVKGNTLKEV